MARSDSRRRLIQNHRGLVAGMSLDELLFIRNGKEAPCFGIEVELKDNRSFPSAGFASDLNICFMPAPYY